MTLDALVQTPSAVTMKTGGASHEWELVQIEKPAGALRHAVTARVPPHAVQGGLRHIR